MKDACIIPEIHSIILAGFTLMIYHHGKLLNVSSDELDHVLKKKTFATSGYFFASGILNVRRVDGCTAVHCTAILRIAAI